jgi:hypothetical protein
MLIGWRKTTTVVATVMVAQTLATPAADAASPGCVPNWDGSIGVPGMSSSYVANLCLYDDGLGSGVQLYATGGFASAGGNTGTGELAKWNGTSWLSVGGGLEAQFSNTMAVFNNSLYVGGYFNVAGGVPGTAKLARWDGAAWNSVNGQLDQFDDSIWALKVFNDGSGNALYVGGNYQDIGGTTYDFIARWNGSTYTEVGGTIAGPVALIVLSLEVFNGELYAGGRFTSIAGIPATHIARWNGTQWQAVGGGITGTQVLCMKVFNDGTGDALYVAGGFTAAGGVPATRIAKWNGTTWSALGAGLSSNVNGLEVFDDGTGAALYATGGFTASGATPVSRIAKWNGSSWSAVGAGLDSTGFALLSYDNGVDTALYIGGSFVNAGGQSANRVARYVACPPPAIPGDINGDGHVNIDDLVLVITSWGNCAQPCPPGCPADVNADCLVNIDDLVLVITHWG